jgi:hypothetical protein
MGQAIASIFLLLMPYTLGKYGLHIPVLFYILTAIAAAVVALICLAIAIPFKVFVGSLVLAAATSFIGLPSFADFKARRILTPFFMSGVLAVAFSTILKAAYSGWVFEFEALTGFIFITAAFHLTLRAAISLRQEIEPPAWLLLVSDIFFIITGLFRWDVGDGPDWLTIFDLLGGGPGYPAARAPAWLGLNLDNGQFYNLALYIPVAICWLATIALMFRTKEDARGAEACP